ncbi:MAG: hypothetical protein LBT50_08120 [Prevotellaceae bacterium]|jgi:cell division protein FtsL|nr:hypothetical protein [Prevotellaceae bacterium]
MKGILKGIFSGSAMEYVQKHYKYLILLFILAVIYISNGLISALAIREQEDLNDKMLRSKTRYNQNLKEVMKFNNYQNLIELTKKYNLGLEEPDKPPLKVEK